MGYAMRYTERGYISISMGCIMKPFGYSMG